MATYIYGAGNFGKGILKKVKKEGHLNCVKAVIDNHKYALKNEDDLKDIPVVNLCEIVNEYEITASDIVIIAVIDYRESVRILGDLIKAGFREIYLRETYICQVGQVDDYEWDILSAEGKPLHLFYKYYDRKPVLDYIVYNITNKCNLNCNGCGILCNLKANQYDEKVDSFRETLERLKILFSDIEYLIISGGEVFLRQDIGDFLYLARKELPYTNIEIATNGILIDKISEKNIKALRECGIRLGISVYPTYEEKIKENEKRLQENGIQYKLHAYRKSFSKFLDSSATSDSRLMYEKHCKDFSCSMVFDNRLFACGRIPHVYRFQEFLDYRISKEEYEDSCADIMDDNISAWEMLMKLYNPVPMCRICADEWDEIEWTNSKTPNKSDYCS